MNRPRDMLLFMTGLSAGAGARGHGYLVILLLVVLVPICSAAGEASVAERLDQAAGLLQQGRADGALRVLDDVAAAEPENPWMWFYRGVAHFRKERPYEALRCYDRGLDVLMQLGDPDPELAERIRRYRRRARRDVFTFSLQTGLAYDTNVSYLGDDAIGTADLISGDDDGRFGSRAELAYAPVATETDTLVIGGRAGQTWHFAIDEFDYQDYGASIRYARRLDDTWEIALQYDYDWTFLGNEPFLSNHVLTPGISFEWPASAGRFQPERTTVYYRFEASEYLFETIPEFDRDALTHGVGVDQTFRWEVVSRWVWDLNAGYRFTSIPTEGMEFDRRTHDFYLGLAMPLINPSSPGEYLIIPDKELAFRFGVQWQLGEYMEPSLIDADGDARSDLITVYTWSLSQKLVEDAGLGDLSLHAIIQWTDSESNVLMRDPELTHIKSEPFTYDKVVYGIQLVWDW